MELKEIGKAGCDEEGFKIVIDRRYSQGLMGLGGFSHVMVLWWFDGCDNEESRTKLVHEKPYANGPDRMGCFATRSPERPNPIAISVSGVTHIDVPNSTIYVDYIDALPETPILDVKPYTPSTDRVESPGVPKWCSHWPKSYEDSGDFEWEKEFNF